LTIHLIRYILGRRTIVHYLGGFIVSYFRKGLLGVGVVLTGLSLLTACQTVEGTFQGAKKDIATDEAVMNRAVTPAHKTEMHKATHHKKAMHKAKHHKKAMHKKADTQENSQNSSSATPKND